MTDSQWRFHCGLASHVHRHYHSSSFHGPAASATVSGISIFSSLAAPTRLEALAAMATLVFFSTKLFLFSGKLFGESERGHRHTLLAPPPFRVCEVASDLHVLLSQHHSLGGLGMGAVFQSQTRRTTSQCSLCCEWRSLITRQHEPMPLMTEELTNKYRRMSRRHSWSASRTDKRAGRQTF